MNLIGFTRLIKMIYGRKLPDLNKIQDMGLLAVKIAQHYALRIDFLDEKVCRHLQELFRTARPAEGENYRELLSHYVDDSWFDNFESIEETPFATASIGQVHKGILKNGDRVVIKVIKGRFADQFLSDIKTLKRSLNAMLFMLPHLKKVFNPMEILNHIEEYTIQELDLTNEIHGAKELIDIQDRYRDSYPPISSLHMPHFYEELSSESVLVSKLIEGKTYDEALQDKELNYEQLLRLFTLHGLFLFGAGRFHGDMHPGNVLAVDQDTLFFVDTGALSSCSKRIREGLFHFFIALSSDDMERAAEALNTIAATPIDVTKQEQFTQRFLELYRDFPGQSVSEVSLTKKMMDTIKLGVNCGMSFDEGMFPIIKSLMYLDGMVLRCNPDAVLLRDMKPIIEEFRPILKI